MQTEKMLVLYIERCRLEAAWLEDLDEFFAEYQPPVSRPQALEFIRNEMRYLTYLIVSVTFLLLDWWFPEILYKAPDILQTLNLPWEWAIRPEICEQTWLYVKLTAALVTSGLCGAVINWVTNVLSLQPLPGYQSIELVEDLY